MSAGMVFVEPRICGGSERFSAVGRLAWGMRRDRETPCSNTVNQNPTHNPGISYHVFRSLISPNLNASIAVGKRTVTAPPKA